MTHTSNDSRRDNTGPVINGERLSARLRYEKGTARLAKGLLTEYGNNKNALKIALDVLVATVRSDWAHICERSLSRSKGESFECIVQSSALADHPAPELAKPCKETLNRWHRMLSFGDPILGPITAFSPEDQQFFSAMGIRSVMMVPIVSGKRFFGFVSVEDREHREWRNEEVRMVETAALMIGAYLAREEKEKNLRQTTEAAEKANRMKSTFVSNISHEIRTPLNGIMGFAEVLKETDDISQVRRHADTILKEAKYLFELVNGLLDHAKLEAEEMSLDPAPMDLAALLLDVETNARLVASKKHLRFGIEKQNLPPRVMADGPRLRQVLSNLVSNAVKFTERGEVRVKAETISTRNKNATVRFSVIDTGMGIDEKDQRKIFESFRQADESSTRRFGGTGLGITIANQLVSLMGGRISLESAIGRGSRFWFDLDFTVLPGRTSQGPVDIDDSAEPVVTSLNILAAEDHPTNQMVIRHHIERNGHRATIASNGLEVLELCASEKFDIVLMDVQMPKMDGVEATRKLRAGNSINRSVPIIAITASADKETRDQCLGAGMNDIITKPLLFERLVDTLAQWTEAAALEMTETQVSGRIEPLESAPPIDYEMLMERLDGDTSFAKILLEGFCDQTDNMLAEMTHSLEKNDMEALRQAAHTIKGGALNIVATDLRRAAKALEESPDLETTSAAPLLSRIASAYRRLKDYVHREMTA